MFDFQLYTPVPASDSMALSFYATDYRWWIHAFSRYAVGFLLSGFYFHLHVTFSDVCLRGRDCMGNNCDILSAFFFLVEMR